MSILYEDLTYTIRGALFEVYNTLGPGFKESIYHRALVKELALQQLNFEDNKSLSIKYKGDNVGNYRPDFIVEDEVIIEIKAVPKMPKLFETQLFYYLKGTNYKLGFLVNFGDEKIDIRRRIYDERRG